jgi:hypothetical protein
LSPFLGKGGINLSYQWLKEKDLKVVKEGRRVSLPETLLPSQSVVLPVNVTIPQSKGRYLLKISLVQEGCSWFYLVNPKSAFTISYVIK